MSIKIILLGLVLYINTFAQVEYLTRFPVQDSTKSIYNSLIIEGNDNIILLFWVESDSLFLSRSEDLGISWSPKSKIAVDNSMNFRRISGIKTKSGRILIGYHSSPNNLIIYSDDNGLSWSGPIDIGLNVNQIFTFSETSTGDLFLIYTGIYYSLFVRKSMDDGLTWEDEKQIIDNGQITTPGNIIAIDDSTYLLITSFIDYYSEKSEIYGIYSFDKGQTWGEYFILEDDSNKDKRHLTVIPRNNLIYLMYVRNNVTYGEQQSEIVYKVSADNGVHWQKINNVTKYVGKNSNLFAYPVGSEIYFSFNSDRFFNINQIWYGILEKSEDLLAPPKIFFIKNFPTEITQKDEVKLEALILDDTKPIDVSVGIMVNDTLRKTVKMFDDGSEADNFANDDIYSVNVGTFNFNDTLRFIVTAKDSDNNTVKKSSKKITVSELEKYTSYLFDINNFLLPMDNKGVLGDVRLRFPDGNSLPSGRVDGESVLYSSGFYISGYVNNELFGSGVLSADRIESYVAGPVGSQPEDSTNMLYILRSSDKPFGRSWEIWKDAVKLGARFYDGDNDGIYNPTDLNGNGVWDSNEDRPDLRGDLTIWCVYNDADTNTDRNFPNHRPLGIEIRQTVFGYSPKTFPELSNVIFINYNIVNTGLVSNSIDSVFFSPATDPDIGYYSNDMVGADTLLNSAYGYDNGYDPLFDNSPAFFVTLLEGPQISIPNITYYDKNNNNQYDEFIDVPITVAIKRKGKYFGVDILEGYSNLGMFSNHSNARSSPNFGVPYNEQGLRYYQLGGRFENGKLIDPCNFSYGIVNNFDCKKVNIKYMYSGDPIEQVGWLCNFHTDHRQYITTGPFDLKKNEPVDVLVAYSVGRGTNSLESIQTTRNIVMDVIRFYKTNFNEIPVDIADDENKDSDIPQKMILKQNYPNPFNPTTTIKYSIPKTDVGSKHALTVQLKVYDVLGREVATLVNQKQKPGNYEVTFNARNLSSGVYYYQLKAGQFIQAKKMLLLK